MTRSDTEIVERVRHVVAPRDFMGFEASDLVLRLPYDAAKEFLADDVKPEDWAKPLSRDRESVLADMLGYMPFAWDKANNFKGLSAMRSMSHYSAWIWLIGDDLGDLLNYEFYGKDNLLRICQHYGWDASKWDDGVRSNHE